MIELLTKIVKTINSLVDFIIHSVTSFLNLLTAIPRFTAYVYNLVNSLIPDILKPFIIISIVIAIILLLLGRNK